MAEKRVKLPRSRSNIQFGRSIARLRKMSMADQIQLLVKAGLMGQDEADRAKQRLIDEAAAAANSPAEAEQPTPQ